MDEHRLDALVAPTGGPAWPTDLVNGDHFTGGSSTPAAVAGYPNITRAGGLGLRAAGRPLVHRPRLERADADPARLRVRADNYAPKGTALPPDARLTLPLRVGDFPRPDRASFNQDLHGRHQRSRHRSAARAGLSRDQLLELYYWMRLTRSLEERLVNLYRQTKVVGGLFRSLGQEACAVGSAYALDREDILSPLIRNLGSMLVQGATPLEVLRQYMAKGDRPRAAASSTSTSATSGRGLRRPDLAPGRHGAGDGRRHALVQDAEASRGSGWCTSATAPPPPARSTKASTSPRCSAARWS